MLLALQEVRYTQVHEVGIEHNFDENRTWECEASDKEYNNYQHAHTTNGQ